MNILNQVPPQAIEEEKALLGAILIERDALSNVVDLVKPEMFYHQYHQSIYSEILEMYAQSQSIDIITVAQRLKTKKIDVGGDYYVTSLTTNVVSSYHIVNHGRIIVEKYLLREQIRIGGELITRAYAQSDPFQNLEDAEKQLHNLSNSIEQNESKKIDEIVIEVCKEIESLRNREHYLIGITSGYKSIDKITMGWQNSDFNIIAARPAVGKTAFTLSLALNASKSNIPTVFFSLEMNAQQLVKRVLASQAKMYLSTIKGARLDDQQMEHLFNKGIKPISSLPLYIDDTASLSVLQFKAKLRRMVRRYNIQIAFVDYLQLLKSSVSKNATRQQQIGDISRELKITAKELNLPIIALSQLSREVEKRSNPTPQLSDLREAGDIEQDADMVMFLYGHTEKEIESDRSIANDIFLKYAKHRNGGLANLKFNYDKDYQIFTEEGEAAEIKSFVNYSNIDNPF